MLRSFLAVVVSLAPLAAQWGPVSTNSGPTERVRPLLAYDLIGGRTLMFGGNWSNEFWSLQNGVWSQLQPATLPGSRHRADLAIDPFTGNVLLYGGDDGQNRIANDETWIWDGTNWTLQAPALTPGGFARHSMAYDTFRQVTVLYGGRRDSWVPMQLSSLTWEWSGGNWTAATLAQSPGPLVEAAMSYHPGLQKVVLFGGEDGLGIANDSTWHYDGAAWTQTNTTGVRPPARSGAKMVPILNRGICVLFGGRDPVTMQIFNDTWEYDGVSWTQVNNVYGGVSPARAEFGMAHDFVRDRIVLFGGVIANNSQQNDVWEFGAQFTRFGSGCAGSAGVPSLTSLSLPRLGTTMSAQIGNLAPQSTVAMMAVGLSRQQWPLGNLPMLLTNFGMPNCRAYTSTDVLTVIPASAGTATWTWNVPAWPGYLGTPFHLQGLSIDPGVNAAGLTVSNAATIVVGI